MRLTLFAILGSFLLSLLAAAQTGSRQTATFSAGCFWGVEEFFRKIPGVVETRVGYTGGDVKDPTYEQVSSGKTGHAESIELKFDPDKVSYERLLTLFFKMHDPTTLNKQGNDEGTQYRSAIFFHDENQKKTAERLKSKAEIAWKAKVVTEISAAKPFYPAEKDHQKYLSVHPGGYDNHFLRELTF
jgi:methionine-S-sulfoxide reductase